MRSFTSNFTFFAAFFAVFVSQGKGFFSFFAIFHIEDASIVLALEIVLGSSSFPPSQLLAVPDQTLQNDVS